MEFKIVNIFISFVVICVIIGRSDAIAERIGCRDENGKLVDWYFLYKLPNKYSDSTKSGLEYLYITPSSQSAWTLSSHLVNSTSSMLGQTLSLVYDKSQSYDFLVAMYNDEPTNAPVDNVRGHTKGVVVANDISGYWIVHSVPKFPPAMDEGGYDYPHSGTTYGQSFLCISFTGDQLAKVGKQLQYNEPRFYSSQVPEYLRRLYPHIVEALDMKKVSVAPFYSLEPLRSRYGSNFVSFAKSGAFKKELYEDLVAPHYNAGDFFVESWRHGPGNIGSDCTKQTKVYNVKDIAIRSSEEISFSTLHDHSKWMVSNDNNLICVGDINRQEHQKVRGGGTVCIQLESVAKVYNQIIVDSEPCSKRRKFVPIEIRNNHVRNDIEYNL
ncbi:deoxyribonuclease-2-alpha [Chironomus tepperi]|uniref:deoxyribonuclease-2-alpha n=1 Tax=Chironomus tepperi TaxID=113505 RepID=UPI00391FA758